MDTLLSLACSDCNNPCEVKFCMLTSQHRIVYLCTCPKCSDGVTLRCFKEIDAVTWLEAAARGLYIVTFKKAA